MKLLRTILLPLMSLWVVVAFAGIPVFEAYCKPEACKPEAVQVGCCSIPVEDENDSCCGISIGWTNAVAGCCSITGTYLQLLVPAKPVAQNQKIEFADHTTVLFAAIPALDLFASGQTSSKIFHPPHHDARAQAGNPFRVLRL